MRLHDYAQQYAQRNEIGTGYAEQLTWCIRAYEKHLKRDAVLADLTAEAINAFLYALRETTLSPETRRLRRRILLALASDAARCRLIEPINRDLVARVKASRRPVSGLTWQQARQVLDSLESARGRNRRWLEARYRNSGITRVDWWRAYLSACWDTGAPADLRDLRFSELELDGRVFRFRQKTGKPLRWKLSGFTMRSIDLIRGDRELVWPLSGSLHLFRRDARKILQGIAGLVGQSLGGFRSGAGTDAELRHGRGAGCELLGNTPAVFARHYEIAPVIDRPTRGPKPLRDAFEEDAWPTDRWYATSDQVTPS